MELLESLKSSLKKQSIEQGNTLYPSSDETYITCSLTWHESVEGYLFWGILHNSYFQHGIYDYVTLVKLYHRYGRDVFNSVFYVRSYYRDYFDRYNSTLSNEGFKRLCNQLERYGIIRRD